ncbi:MAG: hypothetical protein JW821_12425, partial [Deltaproteobacteria bacterium]|nr:hypothetical protein [Deltaproteobacteria bacterium]
EMLLVNFWDNLATRDFNEVEKAMVLTRLSAHLDREEILARHMGLLGLAAHEPLLETYLRIETLNDPVKEALATKGLSLQSARSLLDMAPASRDCVFAWITDLHLNGNQQRQFIEMLNDLSLKDNVDISGILAGEALDRIRRDRESNNPQKARNLFSLLRSMRLPLVSGAEKTFHRRVASLGLPRGVTVEHPPFFEGEGYALKVLFRDGRDLKGRLETLCRLSLAETLKDPWEEE